MQGQADIPLAEVGTKQAELLAKRLKGENWDGIITSDLLRAKQTAQIIADELGIPILSCEPRIRERNFGLLEGTTVSERIERWGENWREADLGMESDDELLARGFAVLEDVATHYSDQRILLVSHGGMIVPMLEKIMEMPLKEHLKNTSLSILKKTNDGWNCLLLNCTKHLDVFE
jgi:probable phosphoglycerate mutase